MSLLRGLPVRSRLRRVRAFGAKKVPPCALDPSNPRPTQAAHNWDPADPATDQGADTPADYKDGPKYANEFPIHGRFPAVNSCKARWRSV